MLDMQYERGWGHAPTGAWGGGLGSGMRRGRLSGSTRRKGGDMERERMFDVHACAGECGTLAEYLGHRHRSLFSYFDREGFSQASLICPA